MSGWTDAEEAGESGHEAREAGMTRTEYWFHFAAGMALLASGLVVGFIGGLQF